MLDGSVYLCPVCRHPGKSPVVNKSSFATNGHLMEEHFDENSQDSMSIASETEDIAGRCELWEGCFFG